MGRALSYALYDAAGVLVSLIALPVLPILRLTRYGRGLGERLGCLPADARGLRRPLWVHAASVGEVLATEPLLQRVRATHPDCPLLLSTTSVTGNAVARARLPVDAAMLLPIDVRWITDRVMRRLQPRGLIIVETELWPALIRSAARYHVPCVLASGRISARAGRRYAWVAWLTRAMLSQVEALAMQTDADAARIVALGAPPTRVQVVGSLKLAREAAGQAAASDDSAAEALLGDRIVLIAASTHPGEEEMVLDACSSLWEPYPELLLVIAPRRPERFDEVDQLLARRGPAHVRRTRLRGHIETETRILLLDSLGELPDLLGRARAVFVGGTIAPVGGHNVLEPALFGKPVAFGPHLANVAAAAAALLEGKAATLVHDAGELRAEWQRLLAEPRLADDMGMCARTVIRAGAAIADRTLAIVERCMAEP